MDLKLEHEETLSLADAGLVYQPVDGDPQLFTWLELAQVRWNSDQETLELLFHPYTMRKPLTLKPAVQPSMSFMERVRAGVEETQFYASVVRLPSGRNENIQILRDVNHDLRLNVSISNLENLLDQQYLHELCDSWREKLGVDVAQAPILD